MSSTVKSLYGPKDGVKKKETFMTMGTFMRFDQNSELEARRCYAFKGSPRVPRRLGEAKFSERGRDVIGQQRKQD
ncbi:hypothetical protein QCA50_019110 [Cerrena zonata]|uniref:Uncharacterized protein n=1 Tax=Cerrena zonata TaxID=2478898 RepID=A0AAW0FMM4_9APHY